MAYDVFVSYASEDRRFVAKLVAGLKRRGLRVWYDQDVLGGPAADFHGKRIESGLLDSRYGVIVLSKHYVGKEWPDAEWGALGTIEMHTKRKIIIPVLHGISVDELSGRLRVFGGKPEDCIRADKPTRRAVNEIARRVKDLDRETARAGDASVGGDPHLKAAADSPLGRWSYYGDRCPQCGKPVIVGSHRVVCSVCDYDDLMEPY